MDRARRNRHGVKGIDFRSAFEIAQRPIHRMQHELGRGGRLRIVGCAHPMWGLQQAGFVQDGVERRLARNRLAAIHPFPFPLDRLDPNQPDLGSFESAVCPLDLLRDMARISHHGLLSSVFLG